MTTHQVSLKLGVVTNDQDFRRCIDRFVAEHDRVVLILSRNRGPLGDIANCASTNPDAVVVDNADTESREALEALTRLFPDLPTVRLQRGDSTDATRGRDLAEPGIGHERIGQHCTVSRGSAHVDQELAAYLVARAIELVALRDGVQQGCPAPLGSEPAPARAEELVSKSQEDFTRALPSREIPVIAAVGIGISTGGPRVLPSTLAALPADFPLPVFVVQHMPEGFTKSFARTLDRNCRLPVIEAEADLPVEGGRVYLAPGGLHLIVERTAHGVFTRLLDTPPERCCRPSVDVLFRSLVEAYRDSVLGVIMTGMGDDGSTGCQEIFEAGGVVYAQSERSCTIYGMPRKSVESGIASMVLDGEALGREIARIGKRRR